MRKEKEKTASLSVLPSSIRKHKHWLLLILIMALELMLAYLPPTILSEVPLLEQGVWLAAKAVPLIEMFGPHVTPNHELVRFYLTLTLFVMPLKVALLVLWLDSDYWGAYRHLVVSPLTREMPKSGLEFVLPAEAQVNKPQAPRSMGSRIILTFLIPCMTGVFMWVHLFVFSGPDSTGVSIQKFYRLVSGGGIDMWYAWDIKTVGLICFMLAVSYCIVRDCALYVFATIRRG